MDEQASFEASAVLAPRRARLTRVALLVPLVALVAVAGAGLGGTRSDRSTAAIPEPTAVPGSVAVEPSGPAVASEASRTELPAQAIGLQVHRLGDVQPQGFGRDEIVAVSGWYVPTAITDCPPLAAIYRNGSLPEVRGDADELAFCVRSGLLYASRPDLDGTLRYRDADAPGVAVTIVVGVIMPLELEIIGTDATEVVVIGRFVDSSGCAVPAGCPEELVVDHVAWALGA